MSKAAGSLQVASTKLSHAKENAGPMQIQSNVWKPAGKPAMDPASLEIGAMISGFLVTRETSVFPQKSGAMESKIALMEQMRRAALCVQR